MTFFTDADLSAPIEESRKLLAAIESGNDVAIGSRAIDRSLIFVHQSRFREIAGIIFNAFVKLFTGVPFHDTQCGFKAFARERSRIIFEQQRIEGFGFDPEILFLAQRHGLRSTEVPVRWAHDSATRVRVFSDSLAHVRGLAGNSLERSRGALSQARRVAGDTALNRARKEAVALAPPKDSSSSSRCCRSRPASRPWSYPDTSRPRPRFSPSAGRTR